MERLLKYMFLFTALPLLLAVSCSEDPFSHEAEATVPQDKDLTMLEVWTHTVPILLETEMDWRVEFEGDCRTFYALPSEGHGSAEIDLCVSKNISEVRRNARMTIVFPQDESRNVVYELCQKCDADYAENDVSYSKSSAVYVVGRGYNVGDEYADISQLKSDILDFQKLAGEGKIGVLPGNRKLVKNKYTGKSVKEISNRFTVKAKLGVKVFGFKKEIGKTFTKEQIESSSSEFAITHLDCILQTISVSEKDPAILAERYLTPGAYAAINGVDSLYAGGEAGVRKLMEDYGTHLILKSYLGGKLKYSMCVDVAGVDGSYNLEEFMNAAAGNAIVSEKDPSTDLYEISYQKNKASCKLRVEAVGGRFEGTDAEGRLVDSDENVERWIASLEARLEKPLDANSTASDGHNLAWLGCPDGAMIPIYQLVDRKKFPARYELLKAYMTGDKLEEVVPQIDADYHCPVPVRFKIPSFSPHHWDEDKPVPQIRDVMDQNGQCVAKVCREFIPAINRTDRIVVVYPVFAGKMKMNMGYYPGDSGHAPISVCWQYEGKNVLRCICRTIEDAKIAKNEYLTVMGSGFVPGAEPDAEEGRLEMSYLTIGSYKYPLVKALDAVWLQQNFSESDYVENGTKVRIPGWERSKGVLRSYFDYYGYETPFEKIVPKGWHVATKQDYLILLDYLVDNDIPFIGLSFIRWKYDGTGLLGLDVQTDAGWLLSRDGHYPENVGYDNGRIYLQTMFWTEDKEQIFISEDNGIYGEIYLDNESYRPYGCLRLVQDNSRYLENKKKTAGL